MSQIDKSSSVNPWEELDLVRQDPEKKRNDGLGQDQFLQLMIAQLQNQDPFNPVQNEDMIAQMAQFSSVKGITDLTKSFGDFVNNMQSQQALQASSLVGRGVLVPSEKGMLWEQGELAGAVELPNSTGNLFINVYDDSGAMVGKLEMGERQKGLAYFVWDGLDENGNRFPPGNYSVKAFMYNNGKQEAVDTLVAARVDSVTLGQGGRGPTLNLTGVGEFGLSDVREIM